MLQVDISDFMFGVKIGHFEGFVKLVPVRKVLYNCIYQIHF